MQQPPPPPELPYPVESERGIAPHKPIHYVTLFRAAAPQVEGLEVTPLTVWHGPGYPSMGYRFGPGDGGLLYISDVSHIPDEVWSSGKIGRPEYCVRANETPTFVPRPRNPTPARGARLDLTPHCRRYRA